MKTPYRTGSSFVLIQRNLVLKKDYQIDVILHVMFRTTFKNAFLSNLSSYSPNIFKGPY